jgi:pyruvate/2-oxoglutarate dehydrogenase complex dihydrolipoamide dehydrogenase (E3) component
MRNLLFLQLKIADHDGGLIVDNRMETSIRDVYAAGDVCSAGWNYDNTHWMQMRLWTQAKQMGEYAARCMIDDNRSASTNNMDICFELFTHVTSFFNFKVNLDDGNNLFDEFR